MHSGAPHGWIASVSPSTLLERRNGYADACSSAAIAFATPAPYAGSAIVQCSICNCWTGFDTPFPYALEMEYLPLSHRILPVLLETAKF